MKNNAQRFTEKELVKVNVIAKAAAELFDKNGYLETSLKDISNAAKLSKGGIYHYFTNKHEILFYIFDTYLDSLMLNLKEELKGISDTIEKIKFIMFRHLKHFNRHVPEARALLNHVHNLPQEYFRIIANRQKEYASILTDVLREFLGDGMDITKVKSITYIMFGMCNSIMYWYDPKGPVSLDELSEICFNIFMSGIGTFRTAS